MPRRRKKARSELYERPTYTMLQERLAVNVRRIRTRLGLTQEQAAHESTMATRLFQGIEGGSVNVTLVTVARLSDGLGCDIRRLFEPLPKNKATRR